MANNSIQINDTLFISAGAGSGKTHRLTHDLADFLTKQNNNGHNADNSGKPVQIEPSQIIATTFTKAAAAEIKERARHELLSLHTPDGIQKATLLETAAIGTIHSVAQKFINKYWYLLGSCPNQDVLTDEDKDIYRNQSLALLMENTNFTTQHEAIDRFFREFRPTHYVDTFSVPNPEFWADDVAKIVQRATYYGIKDLGAKSESRTKSMDEIDSLFGKVVIPTVQALSIVFDDLIKAMNDNIKTKNGKYVANENKTIKTLSELKDKYCKTDTNGILKLPNDIVSYTLLLKVYNVIKEYNKLEKTKKSGIPLQSSSLQALYDLLTSTYYGDIIKACMNAVFDIAQAWISDYEGFKRTRGVIDYDDMEKGFYRLIEDYSECTDDSEKIDNSQVIADIRASYKLILVDEFQDCNPMQLKIFSRLSHIIAGNSGLPYSSIWVGDPNQSIYGFRGSDTNLINRVKSLFTATYPQKTADGLSLDTLKKSYRSREELVTYANNLFKSPFFADFTPLDATRCSGDEIKLNVPAVQQWNFQKANNNDTNNLIVFARHLDKIVDKQLYMVQKEDDDHNECAREIQYSDIAILARKNTDLDKIVKVLREEGVPASAPESKIFDRAEVQLVLAIINLLQNKKDDNGNTVTVEDPHELASLLRLWNDQTTEDIIAERCNVVMRGTDWTNQHTSDLDPIRLALKHAKDLPIDQKIQTIILELDLYDRVNKWGDGDVRRQNLMTLQSVATQFVSRCKRLGIKPTEKEFTLYLKDADINPEKDNTSNSVRVFTYHGSKGLQWPMVILYSLDNDDLALDEVEGNDPLNKFFRREYFGVHEVQKPTQCGTVSTIFPDYHINYFPAPVDGAIEPIRPKVVASSIYKTAKTRQIDESKRLFYVGVTRARDYVIYFTQPYFSKDTNPDCDVRWEKDFCWPNTMGLHDDDLNPRGIEIFRPLIPPVPQEMNVPKKKTPGETKEELEARKAAAIDYNENKYPTLKNEYSNAIAAEHAIQQSRLAPKNVDLHDIAPLSPLGLDDKYLHPSKLSKGNIVVKSQYSYTKLKDTTNVSIAPKSDTIHYADNALGSCIHNIFAAYPYGSRYKLSDEEHQAYCDTAKAIVNNYNLCNVITDIPALVNNFLAMLQWLEKKYGPATHVVHEYPFNYPYGTGNNQVVRGEIDFVYCTPTTDVIIDFKNFHQDPDWLIQKVKDHEAHFVGTHYVTQLTMYHDIWSKANPNKTVHTYLYYDLLGLVIQV